ncbi:hypothetical protein GA0074692_1268 [Micromonospora pallida]|uniref:GEVED domain-containing protein n=1 Tax=Micromonospora pallida TaxID=145854 RepID=A0A1C6RX86_9ACTN|nr:GEVED domain-containing protein [Micromonospora pallida]SCL21844.1 hypothetical protein GA0074692_1268 [Micromonospora pallida]
MARRTASASLLPAVLLFVLLVGPAGTAASQPTGTASSVARPEQARGVGESGCDHGWDYGDASPPYPTTRAQHGPRHRITVIGRLTIGTSVTADRNGRPGDGDVDDGLATPVRLSADAPQVTVRVRNTSGSPALLAGWLDTDRDGFSASERAVVRVPVGARNVTLRWPAPAGAPAGAGQLRLRLYPGRPVHPDPTGVAVGGEVEDYRVTLVGAPQPTPTSPAPQPTPTQPTPQPTPTTGAPQPGPPTPTPTRTSSPTPGTTPTPTATSPPAPTPPSRPMSAGVRTPTRAEPSPPRRGLPLTWSVALLIVAPAAAGAAHAVGRSARRSR